MQLDSHMRFYQDWDIELINMLHSCDAGEKSVLTVYAPHYFYQTIDDKKETFYNSMIFGMRWFGRMLDMMPV